MMLNHLKKHFQQGPMVSGYLARKYQLGTLFLLETGPPFYAVIRATRKSSRL